MAMGRRLWTPAMLMACVVLGSPATNAQRTTVHGLATVKAVTCVFPLYATGTWSEAKAEAQIKPSSVSVAFDAIDTEDGTARATGAYGPIHLVVKLAAYSLHFLDMSSDGMLRVTTVFDKESRPGKLKAVHTRHEYTDISLPGFTSRPEQYYGECEVSLIRFRGQFNYAA